MKIVEYIYHREINANIDSILWNYWDHEHLYVVHDNYLNAKVFFEDSKLACLFLDFKLPVFSFLKSRSLNIMYMQNKNTIKVFNQGLFGLVSETTISINEIESNFCKLKMTYKFFLSGWLRVLEPFLEKMTRNWNKKVWDEDLSLKLRRSNLLQRGFKDFIGMTDERKKVQEFNLPIKRHLDSPINLKNTNAKKSKKNAE